MACLRDLVPTLDNLAATWLQNRDILIETFGDIDANNLMKFAGTFGKFLPGKR
jgi:hypothetical protein